MKTMRKLEFFAALFAIVGSIWLAQNVGSSSWGWSLFLISSLLWVIYSYKAKMNAMLVQSIVFTMSNISGIWHWLIPGLGS